MLAQQNHTSPNHWMKSQMLENDLSKREEGENWCKEQAQQARIGNFIFGCVHKRCLAFLNEGRLCFLEADVYINATPSSEIGCDRRPRRHG
jgi:hypothetical protein